MRTVSTTIEQLELEVQSSATSAVAQLDALASSLGKVKDATKGGVGLTSVAKQLTTLNTALSSISSANADNLNKMARGLQTLSTCGNLKLSSSVANQITNLGTAVRSLNGTNYSSLSQLANALTPLSTIGKSNLNSFISQLQRLPQAVQALNSVSMGDLSSKLSELVSAFSQLSNMGKNNLTSFITQLNKIPKLMENLKNVDMRTLYNQIQSLVRVFTPLATQMEKVSAGFAAFPTRIQKLITSTDNLSKSNTKASTSYVNLAAKIGLAVAAVKSAASVLAGFINKSNQYVEDLNLFTASMGEYASAAQEYAERVSNLMGIDPAEWMRNQGVFMTITEGFGVASDRAYTMSQNLTQLGYDISSLFNISYSDAFQKLQSGISGELEPLRRLGYDLSVARLQQEAYTLGIEKKVSAMTQAEKAELRYYAIMTQVTTAQGDMARTLDAPANQLRILQAQVTQCARAIGNIFIPALNAILPYAIAVANVIRLIADAIAKLFGFSLPEIDYSGIGSSVSGIADSTDDISDGLGDATKKAKELKNALLGIDELNVISPPEDTSSSGSSGVGSLGGGGLGFDLPTYDFIGDAVGSRIDEIIQKMKEWLGITDGISSWSDLFDSRLGKILLTVTAIGAGLAAWKIAKSITNFLNTLSNMKGFSTPTGLVGFIMLIADLKKFTEYLQDILENGASVKNVAGLIAEGLGAIGDAFIILGNVKLGGVLKIVQGVGEIVSACADIANNDVNWDNVSTAISGISNIGIGIGLLTMKTGGLKIVGWSLVAQGISGVLGEIDNIMEAIRTGKWEGVDKVTLIISAIEIIGGLAVALDAFSKLKEVATISTATEATTSVATAVETLDTTVSTKLSPNLTSLAKNLGLGIVIIGEVAVAAGLIVGSIILLGEGLAQVGDSWQPVIANAGTVAIAVGIGTAALVAVGVATALLGSAGTTLIVNIALGTAILAELGVATGLFLVEIWAIGKGLDEIGQAWQPVLDNGETIATGIGLGTALLVGIGVVTAALGVATVASAGLLPLAIGLGTALLVELAVAFVAFCESLVAVADELSDNLAPALDNLNGDLPSLSTNMSEFVDFMTAFAGQVVRYTEVSAIAGLSATVDTIIGWFTKDPIETLAEDVENIYGQVSDLNDKLEVAVPELETAIELLSDYKGFLTEMESLCNTSVDLSTGMFVNMNDVGQQLVTGFVAGIKSKSSDFSNAAKTLVDGFKNTLTTNVATCKSSIISWASNLKTWFTSSAYGAVNRTTFGDYAKDIINGFKNGITANYSIARAGMVTFANDVKKAFTDLISYKVFYNIAKDVIDGFNKGINDFYYTTERYMRTWANDAAAAYKAALDSNSPSKRFMRIGEDTVLGYNLGISNLSGTTRGVVDDWANSFSSVSPTMSFAVDTSALKYYNSDSFAQSVSADVATHSTVTATGFKEGMEEFYREYIEPTLSQMADDMRRQADKQEKTVVQIGNRVVNDAVTTQQKANGYVFAR